MLTFPKLCWPPPHPWGELNKESLESTSSWPQKLVRCGQWHLKIVVKSIPKWRFYPGKSFHPAVSLFQWSSTPSSSICRRSLFLNAIVLGSFLKFKLQSIRTLWKLIIFSKNISQILAFLWALDGANKQLFLDQDCSISHTRKHCQSIGNAILMTITSLSNLYLSKVAGMQASKKKYFEYFQFFELTTSCVVQRSSNNRLFLQRIT